MLKSTHKDKNTKRLIYDLDIPTEITISIYETNFNLTLDDEPESIPFDYQFIKLNDDTTAVTEKSSDLSASENASHCSVEVYQLFEGESQFNYRGPKVLPTNETPVTICICNTIGYIRSQKIFRILLDSGSNTCLIKRLCLPNDIVPIELNSNKSFTTLTGKLSAS